MGGGGSKGYFEDDDNSAAVNSLYKIVEGEEFVTSGGRKIEVSEVLELCKDLGVDINSVNGKGESVLIVAAKKGNYKALDELLKSEADIDIVDKSGKTAFDYAYENDDAKIAARLIYKNYKEDDCEKWFAKVTENEGFARRLSSELGLLNNSVLEFSPPSSAVSSPRSDVSENLTLKGINISTK